MEIKLGKFALELIGAEKQVRRLSDLKDFFADKSAADRILKTEDPVVYEVYACEPADKSGNLSYAVTAINPGDVGGEYYMTKGHFHKKDVAEIYVGLDGEGVLLMQDRKDAVRKSKISPGKIAYVPKGFAHRAVNTGRKRLRFLAIYSSDSGHDYGTIESSGFKERITK